MRVVSFFEENQVELGEDDPHEFDQFGRKAHGIIDLLRAAAFFPLTSPGNKQHVEETGEVLIVSPRLTQRAMSLCSRRSAMIRTSPVSTCRRNRGGSYHCGPARAETHS